MDRTEDAVPMPALGVAPEVYSFNAQSEGERLKHVVLKELGA